MIDQINSRIHCAHYDALSYDSHRIGSTDAVARNLT